jgi:hypothetical protein
MSASSRLEHEELTRGLEGQVLPNLPGGAGRGSRSPAAEIEGLRRSRASASPLSPSAEEKPRLLE